MSAKHPEKLGIDWLKSTMSRVIENTYFDPFLPGHPIWIATKAYTKPSECPHYNLCLCFNTQAYKEGTIKTNLKAFVIVLHSFTS